jgi:hypothetical protein
MKRRRVKQHSLVSMASQVKSAQVAARVVPNSLHRYVVTSACCKDECVEESCLEACHNNDPELFNDVLHWLQQSPDR